MNVEVRLDDFSVESSLTDFKPGVPYHFTLINEGKIPHEFMIIPVPVAGVHSHGSEELPMKEQHEVALVLVPESRLPAGATVELDYTFEKVPQEPLEMPCALPGHFEAGMHPPITIR